MRFWAVCTGPNTVAMDKASVDYLARRLAKFGVNMIRIHGPIFDRSAADPAQVDAAYLDKLHYFVYAMKQQGIYSYLSIYFPLWFDVKPNYGLPGYDKTENKVPFALLFFNPRMQEIYRSWARALLTSANPYTGLPFADDPAVGIDEIINEDNYFFWTFTPGTNIPWECMPPLEERYGAWAAKKYGSLDAALKAWNYPDKRDDASAGRAGFLAPWAMTRGGIAGLPTARQRTSDQVQFLTEDLRGFYEGMRDWLRKDLRVKCPVVATNWTTADNDTLGALDKYTNMACDVLDRHGYWTPPRKADRDYTLTAGDLFKNQCGLEVPEQLPVRELQYAGHPHTVSEYLFTRINDYRTDSVFLAAVYGALQGTDAFFWFAINGPSWQTSGGEGPASPAIMGQFPAAALIYRRGDVREATTVINQVVSLADLYALKGSGTADPQNLDTMRAAEVPPGGQAIGKAVPNIDPLSYYVGRVLRTISDDRAQALLTDLSPYIDRTAKTVRSITGEADAGLRQGPCHGKHAARAGGHGLPGPRRPHRPRRRGYRERQRLRRRHGRLAGRPADRLGRQGPASGRNPGAELRLGGRPGGRVAQGDEPGHPAAGREEHRWQGDHRAGRRRAAQGDGPRPERLPDRPQGRDDGRRRTADHHAPAGRALLRGGAALNTRVGQAPRLPRGRGRPRYRWQGSGPVVTVEEGEPAERGPGQSRHGRQ